MPKYPRDLQPSTKHVTVAVKGPVSHSNSRRIPLGVMNVSEHYAPKIALSTILKPIHTSGDVKRTKI
tara:strand:+ start:1179 stop:1379 length:201 start_codon:yes stop_codon:yes gene_type:complete